MGKVGRALTGIVGFAVGALIGGPIGAAIGGFIGKAVGSKLFKPKGKRRDAVAATLQLGEVSRQALFGRAATAGSLVDAFNYGGKYGTDWEVLVIALADHRCDALESFYVNDALVNYTGDGAVPGYNDQLMIWWRPGTMTQSVPSVLTANGPGWTANDNGAGVCYAVVAYKADKSDAKNPVWPGGRPKFQFILRGLRCYQARKDSSIGGSGAHRRDNPATWEWTDNAIDCRYNYARGIYAGDQVGDPAQLLVGRGLSAVEAPPGNVFARANLCDEIVDGEKRYTVGGAVSSDEAYGAVEEEFAAACAGVIVQPEGAVEIDPGEAKAPVVTITDADLVVGTTVKFSHFLSVNDSEWINTVVAQYVEPAQKWSQHSAPVRRDVADITADRGAREQTITLGLVTSGKQAGRIAEIVRRLGRLWGRAELTLPPRFAWLEEGDWIVWQSDRYLEGGAQTYRVESWQSDRGWKHALVLRQISASVYSDTAPLTDGSVAIDQAPRPNVAAPDIGSWTLSTGHMDGGGVRQPILVITGANDDPAAQFVRFEYLQAATLPANPAWIDAGLMGPDVTRRDIAAAPGASYFVAISVVVDGLAGDKRVLGPITAPQATYPDGTPIEDLQPDGPGANRTQDHPAAGVTGAGSGLYANSLDELNADDGNALARASLLSGDNLLVNGDLGAGLDRIFTVNAGTTVGTLYQPTNDAPYVETTLGTGSARLYFTGDAASNGYNADLPRVTGGEVLHISKQGRSQTNGLRRRSYCTFYGANGAGLGTIQAQEFSGSTGGIWTEELGSVLVPDGAAFVLFWVELFASGSGVNAVRNIRLARTVKGADLTDENTKVKSVDFNAGNGENLLRDPLFLEGDRYYSVVSGAAVQLINNGTQSYFEKTASGSGVVYSIADADSGETKLGREAGLRPGGTYQVTVEIKAPNGGLFRLNTRAWDGNNGDGVVKTIETGASYPNWTTLRGTVTLPANRPTMQIFPEMFGIGQQWRNLRLSALGRLADFNAVDAGGPEVVGTLPVSKASAGLKNSELTLNSDGSLTDNNGGSPISRGGIDALQLPNGPATPNADKTAAAQIVITPPSPQVIYRDFEGAPKSGQFPRTLVPVIRRGGTDIRTSNDCSYSITASNVTAAINNTNGNADKGKITVTAGGAGFIQLTVTISGTVYGPFSIPFTVKDDPAPQQSGGGGGGGIKSANDSTFAELTSASYIRLTSTDAGENILTLDMASGEKLRGTAPLTYQSIDTSAPGTAMRGKWRYRLVGNTTWLDFDGAPITGGNSYKEYDFELDTTYDNSGSIAVTQEKVGLAAGQYECALFGELTNAAQNITIFDGTATVQAIT